MNRAPGHFYDINDQGLAVQFPPNWMPDAMGSSFVDVNTSGRIVGSLKGPDGSSTGFYLDLFPTDVNGDPLPRELKPIDPPFQTGNQFYGRDVNEAGDILVVSHDGVPGGAVGEGYPYIFNPENNEHIEIPVLSNHRVAFNNFRQVMGLRRTDDVVFRHTITQPDGSGITETFPDLASPYSVSPNINDFGEFAATIYIPRGRDKGLYPVQVGMNGSIEWQASLEGTATIPINNSRDLVFYDDFGNDLGDFWLYHEHSSQVFSINELVPDPEFQPTSSISISLVGERDSSQLPWLVGRAVVNAESGFDEAFILIPVSSEPTPGISVTPTEGLSTTEAGGQATFEVVLDAEPSDDVTIAVSSSDTTEGTLLSASTLTFTTTEWNISQTVKIEGVDDSAADGNIDYTIDLAASGGDYEGLTADVTVTNQDNEVSNITMIVDDPSINEGNRGDQTEGQFTISLSGAASSDVQVWYQVSNGSAKKNKDYAMVDSASGLLTFVAGETSQTVSFIVLGDTRREADETFTIELTDAFGATISKSVGTATIIDND